MSLGIEVFSPATWGDTIARRLAARLDIRPDLRLCLPTGRTPTPAYAAFAGSDIGRMNSATLFLLDEFGIPPGHPARCDEMLQRDLLAELARPPRTLHALDVQAPDLEAECARFETLLQDGGLDLTLLGLGGNGHLGLNEPGATADSRTRRVHLDAGTVESAASYGRGEAPRWGLTMGIGTILESREIWILVTGTRKAEILSRMISGPIGPELPASYLRTHKNAHLLMDEESAAGLA